MLPSAVFYSSFFSLSLSLLFLVSQFLFSQSGKYYIILVWVFAFIVALSPFYSAVINCHCCNFVCPALESVGDWCEKIPDFEIISHLSRWRVMLLKTTQRMLQMMSARFLFCVVDSQHI